MLQLRTRLSHLGRIGGPRRDELGLPRDPRPLSGAEVAVAVLVSAALTAAWFWPLLVHLDSRMLGQPGDGSSSIRDYWAARAQHTTVFTWAHDRLATAPEGTPRSGAIALANAAFPLTIMALRPVAGWIGAWNLTILFGFVANATVTYVVLRILRLGPIGAAFGAYVVAFNTFVVEKALFGQAAFVQVWVFPLLVLGVARLNRRRSLAAGVVVGALTALAFYIDSYFGLLAILVVALGLVLALASQRPLRGGGWRRPVLAYATAIATLAVLFAPPLVFWLMSRSTVSAVLSRPTSNLQSLGASVWAYLRPSGRHPLLGSLGQASTQTTSGEPTLFAGYSTILLAGAAAYLLFRRRDLLTTAQRRVAITALTLVPIAFVMSLPRTINLFGVHLPAPSFAIGEFVTYWRVYARFGFLVLMGLGIAAAVSIDVLSRRLGKRALGIALLVLVAFELMPPFPAPTWAAGAAPPRVIWLRDHATGNVAYYPNPEDAAQTLYLMNREYAYQRFAGRPLFNLFGGGWAGTRAEAIRIIAHNPTDPITPHVLAAEGVSDVVLIRDAYRAEDQPLPRLDPRDYHLVATLPDSLIYQVRAQPADLLRTLGAERLRVALAQALPAPAVAPSSGFYGPELWHDGRYWQWMKTRGTLSIASRSTSLYNVDFSAFSHGVSRTLTITDDHGRFIGRVVVPPYQQSYELASIRIPTDVHQLVFAATPGAEELGGDDTRVTSVYLSPVTLQPLADYPAAPGSR